MNNIAEGILHTLIEHRRIEGTERLAQIIGSHTEDVKANVLILHRLGLIKMTISPIGGRGHKSVYELGPNYTVTNAGTK